MKINTELKTLLENLYPKYTLLKICQQLDIDFPSNLKELSYLNKEDITTNLLTHTSESELLSTLKKFPTNAHSSFIATSYVIKNRMIIKENGYKKLILSLNKINNNNPLIVKKLLKLILELNGSINTNIIKIYFKNKSTIITEVLEKLYANPHVAMTEKDMTSTVFSFGRDQGHFGRILNQTVVVEQTLNVRNDHEITGFCFTPQDGNSILSSVAAAEWFLYPHSYEDKIQCLSEYFYDQI